MFKRLASEALGLSDIGVIVPPADYNKVDADDYLFSEDGEKIFFLIKSKKDEYCFTNLGLIHVDGDSAVSSKRTIRRYEFATHSVANVVLETAGTIDMDVELKFVIDGDVPFSIDVRKNFIEQLKDIYKALITIGKIQRRDELARANALECLQVAGSVYKLNSVAADDSIAQQFNTLLTHYNTATLDRYTRRDFSAVFERYIHN
jgi:Bacterial PH domain/YvbH-like oligomerisation region